MAEPLRFAGSHGPRNDRSWQANSAVTSLAHASFSTPTPYGCGRINAIRNHEQIREFCRFLAHEWGGNRHHSYAVPSRGKSSAWSRTVDGKWSANGLADAVSKYASSGKSFSENKAELDQLAADLQSAIRRNSNNEVCAILREIMHWGGVDNRHRQKRTFEWIERNADEISAKLSNAVNLIKDDRASLDSFDGVNLIMNSTMTKIVSLADPEQRLVIYDGRIGGALGFFVARFTEEREIHQYDVADQLLFAVDREAKRSPETKRIHFPALFGKTRDRCHASMVRWASQLIWQVAKECQASPREIEAALFMWGYNVAEEPED
ncbi:hypothetical protein [Bradyrhizobium sp.]|uniref:hypothetical protein n=1 Tax=Bradyrhizobium sp. TaxID=376 RepID=UPI003C71EA00